MILKSLNHLDPKFGYPDEIQYDDKRFHGHQKGVCIGLKNVNTNKIEQNFLSESIENRDELLEELLSLEGVILAQESITQFDEAGKNLIPKILYYLPYAVKDHSVFQPTLNDDNVETRASNVSNRFEVEILFVTDNLNRYITIPFETRNISMFESVDDMFDDTFDEDHKLYKAGMRWKDETEDEEAGYYLDFYNEAGKRFDVGFSRLEDFRDTIASVRLLSHVLIIDKVGESNGGEI